MFGFITKYLWLIGLVITAGRHYLSAKHKDEALKRQPELTESYDWVLWGATIFYGLPGLIMGLGLITGHGQSTFDYIKISTDPFVVVFQLTTILLIAAISSWVWFLGGALVLAPYLELTPFKVKLHFAAGMLLMAFVAAMVWLSRSASPH